MGAAQRGSVLLRGDKQGGGRRQSWEEAVRWVSPLPQACARHPMSVGSQLRGNAIAWDPLLFCFYRC